MYLREHNPRKLAYNFVLLFNMQADKMEMYKGLFNGKSNDNAVLTFCYIDSEFGISFKVICCARIDDNGSVKYEVPEMITIEMTLRERSIDSEAIIVEDDSIIELFRNRAEEIIKCYGWCEEITSVSEEMLFGNYRHPFYESEICTYFLTPDGQFEQLWVEELDQNEDGSINGKLINEPHNSLIKLHEGDEVIIAPHEVEGEIMPFALLQWMNGIETDTGK